MSIRITVETRNLFTGFDLDAAFTGHLSPPNAWATLVASDPARRAESWADEIEASQPDIVGLQEAMLFGTGPLMSSGPAETVAFDFVELLVNALEARGLTYVPETMIDNLDVVVPIYAPPSMTFNCYLTDRNVILVRDHRKKPKILKTEVSTSGAFTTSVPPIPGMSLKRGWNAVDLVVHEQRLRVINTHLEASSPEVAAGQAVELLAGPADWKGPTILLGDFNANSGDAAYDLLTRAGYVDVWPLVGSGTGFTCCHDDLTTSNPYSERIDVVFSRGGITPISADLIGDVPGPGFPFFASDHAGVVAMLELD